MILYFFIIIFIEGFNIKSMEITSIWFTRHDLSQVGRGKKRGDEKVKENWDKTTKNLASLFNSDKGKLLKSSDEADNQKACWLSSRTSSIFVP